MGPERKPHGAKRKRPPKDNPTAAVIFPVPLSGVGSYFM